MADLVTHLASALLPGVGLKRPDHAVLLALGAALPDLGGRAPGILAEILDSAGHTPPGWLPVPFGVLHQPVGGALFAILLAFLLPARDRPAGAGLLAGGVVLHLALDVLQHHHGFGYSLFVPFAFSRFELGWIGSEATVPWAPWLALATVLAWGVRACLTTRSRSPTERTRR